MRQNATPKKPRKKGRPLSAKDGLAAFNWRSSPPYGRLTCTLTWVHNNAPYETSLYLDGDDTPQAREGIEADLIKLMRDWRRRRAKPQEAT